MADPNYRGGLAFGLIMNQIKDLLRKEKAIVYGFTNPVSHKLFSKVLATYFLIKTKHPVYSLIIEPGELLNTPNFVKTAVGTVTRGLTRTRLGLAGSHNINVDMADVIPEEVSRLWEEVRQEYHLIFKRDAAYLNWRFCQVPQGPCQIWLAQDGQGLAGYLVTAVADAGTRPKPLSWIGWCRLKDRRSSRPFWTKP